MTYSPYTHTCVEHPRLSCPACRRAEEHRPDFTVQAEGSILLLQPNTPAAQSWVEEHIGKKNGYQPYWPTVVIEPRYVGDIIEGIQSDGLTVA